VLPQKLVGWHSLAIGSAIAGWVIASSPSTMKGVTMYALIWEESGATVIEYGILIVLIAMAAMMAVTMVGRHLEVFFKTVTSKL
jgi:Flp pilus assembly pilin Flp